MTSKFISPLLNSHLGANLLNPEVKLTILLEKSNKHFRLTLSVNVLQNLFFPPVFPVSKTLIK